MATYSIAEAKDQLSKLVRQATEGERSTPGAQDFALADRLVRDYSTKLAAADALHLASTKNGGARLATFDLRLAEAARMAGVELAGPG